MKRPLTDVHIKIIPQKEHRERFYVGDYWEEDEGATLQVRATDLGDWQKSMAIIQHELLEYLLCRNRGIEEPDILAFDRLFEKEQRVTHGTNEAGDDPRAPYRREHEVSNIVENIYLYEMGITQKEYNDAIDKAWGEK